MIRHVPFDRLGRFDLDWLQSRFHFDFSGVGAPMGGRFGPLRVWNDDLIRPHSGFDMHGHRDMEIITYVRRGAISHTDHLGNKGRTTAGDVQVMHAGRGIMHGEWNHEDEDTLLYQIWIEPNRLGVAAGWAEAEFPRADRGGRFVPLASGQQGVAGALPIHADATLYGAMLPAGAELIHRLGEGRRAYLVLSDGEASVNGQALAARDGAAIEGEREVRVKAARDSDVLLFDVP